MKKKLFIIIPILLIVFILILILTPKKEGSEKTGEDFLKKYYSFSEQDYVNRENVADNEKLAKKLQEEYKDIAWSDCIDLLVQNRYYDQIQEVYIKEGNNALQFQKAELDIIEKGSDDENTDFYNYECTFKVNNNVYIAAGQLSMEKNEGLWKAKRFAPASIKKQ